LQRGNSYDEDYDAYKFISHQILLVTVKVAESAVVFEPTLDECRSVIYRCFLEIIEGGKGIPRVGICGIDL
jgi:hypothetical protein